MFRNLMETGFIERYIFHFSVSRTRKFFWHSNMSLVIFHQQQERKKMKAWKHKLEEKKWEGKEIIFACAVLFYVAAPSFVVVAIRALWLNERKTKENKLIFLIKLWKLS